MIPDFLPIMIHKSRIEINQWQVQMMVHLALQYFWNWQEFCLIVLTKMSGLYFLMQKIKEILKVGIGFLDHVVLLMCWMGNRML